MRNVVIINGKVTHVSAGSNVSISGDKVVVDGKVISEFSQETPPINISIEGQVGILDVSVCQKIDVTGSVGTVKTQSGDVYCGQVSGHVTTQSGDVEAADVQGNVSTQSGSVKCGTVKGNVNTMTGNIRHS
jgi:hypothetical protein